MEQKRRSLGYQTTWMDDFADFSLARRNSHRRSVSDPIAFIEPPPFINNELCRNSHANHHHHQSLMPNYNCSNDNGFGFEQLDDEQLISMFSDDFTTTTASFQSTRSSFSTSSDRNSDNDVQRKVTPPEEEEQQPPPQLKREVEDSGGDCEQETDSAKADHVAFSGGDGGTVVDPKRVKRILANRQSAQRSRVRKLHYISELERSVTNLQTEVSTLSPRVAFLDHQRLILNVDNSSLKQRIAALAQDKIFKDAHQEALKKEIERLRRVYHEQNMKKKKVAENTTTTTGSPESMASPAAVNGGRDEEECEVSFVFKRSEV